MAIAPTIGRIAPPKLDRALVPKGKDWHCYADETEGPQLVAEQIEPGLWWTDEVSEHTGLPPDGLVYHYHPVTFIRWVNEKILETAADPSMQMQTIDASETSEVTGMTSDAGEDSEGHDGDMISDFDLDPEAADKMIQNQHLVEGYAGEANMLMMEDEP